MLLHTKVKNKVGTTDNPLNEAPNWLQYWKDHFKNQINATSCSNADCNFKFEKLEIIGAHVEKFDSIDTDTYIIPLCKDCNNQDSNITMSVPGFLLVPEKE